MLRPAVCTSNGGSLWCGDHSFAVVYICVGLPPIYKHEPVPRGSFVLHRGVVLEVKRGHCNAPNLRGCRD